VHLSCDASNVKEDVDCLSQNGSLAPSREGAVEGAMVMWLLLAIAAVVLLLWLLENLTR
jgi:hypothetical protein